jgi:hypothetical protein
MVENGDKGCLCLLPDFSGKDLRLFHNIAMGFVQMFSISFEVPFIFSFLRVFLVIING